MKVSRAQVMEFLHERSQDDVARQAEQRLPDPVDTEENAGLLSEYGIEVADLATLGMEESAEVTPSQDVRPDDRTPEEEEAAAAGEAPTPEGRSSDETAGAAVKASGEEDSA